MIPLLIIALGIWWFVLQFHGVRPIKWDRRKQAFLFVAQYVAADCRAAWHWKKREEGTIDWDR